MFNKPNADIKEYAHSKGIFMWQVAEIYGLHESNFSRLMRHTLSDSDRNRVISIIDQLASEESKA